MAGAGAQLRSNHLKPQGSHWSRRWLQVLPGQFGFDPLQSSRRQARTSLVNWRRIEEPGKRVLISTIEPSVGGVNTMLEFVVRLMRRRGYEPVIAHYEPYSRSPQLSVPAFTLMRRTPGLQIRREHGCEAHAIGAWLPELEFTHYAATQYWKSLIESCSAYISVSGNVLAATPYYQSGKPFLSWVAAGWHDDRKEPGEEVSRSSQADRPRHRCTKREEARKDNSAKRKNHGA